MEKTSKTGTTLKPTPWTFSKWILEMFLFGVRNFPLIFMDGSGVTGMKHVIHTRPPTLVAKQTIDSKTSNGSMGLD